MDRIFISDLSVRCIIGVGKEERRERQDVLINVSLFADLEEAGRSDLFENAIDYRSIKKKIVRMVEDSDFHLVEALAEAIAGICLEQPAVIEALVRVEKPGALRFARSVGAEISRRRKA
jgi:FolB domain-containing protein